MITAVDSNVLIDIFEADSRFARRSADALKHCRREGRLVLSGVAWAEVASRFPTVEACLAALRKAGVELVPLTEEAATLAGQLWREYRSRGGIRERIVSDFLIGAHALRQAERLLTRDRGFYRVYFSGLPVLDPSA